MARWCDSPDRPAGQRPCRRQPHTRLDREALNCERGKVARTADDLPPARAGGIKTRDPLASSRHGWRQGPRNIEIKSDHQGSVKLGQLPRRQRADERRQLRFEHEGEEVAAQGRGARKALSLADHDLCRDARGSGCRPGRR